MESAYVRDAEKPVYYNTNEHEINYSADIKGNRTEFNLALENELVDGEVMIKCIDVNLRVPAKINWLLVIMTCGLYYLAVKFCAACVTRFMGIARGKLVVTNKGRVGLWTSGIRGQKAGACCSAQAMKSTTSITWNPIHQLVGTQIATAKRSVLCGLCRPKTGTSMRLFFGRYPRKGFWTDGNPIAKIPAAMVTTTSTGDLSVNYGPMHAAFGNAGDISSGATVSVAIDKSLMLARKIFFFNFHIFTGFARYFMMELRMAIMDLFGLFQPGGFVTLFLDTVNPKTCEMSLYANGSDEYHQPDLSALYDFVHFQHILLALKNPAAPVKFTKMQNREAAEGRYRRGTTHDTLFPVQFYTNTVPTVYVDQTLLPMFEGEEITDVLPQPPTSGFDDPTVLCSLCCPSRYQSATLLTNKRIVSLETRGVVGELNSDYQQSTFFLGDLAESEGYIEHTGVETSITMTSPYYGTISITASADRGSLLEGCCAVNEPLYERHHEFMRNLMSSLPFRKGQEPIVGAIPEIPDDVADNTPLIQGEELIGLLKSDNMYNVDDLMAIPACYAMSCGKRPALIEIGRILTCGFRPIEADVHAMVTTHRVVGLVSFRNSCTTWWLTPRYKLFYWAPVQKMSGMVVSGTVEAGEDCFTKNCPGPCCSSMSAYSEVAIRVDGSYPVVVGAADFMASKRGGMLDYEGIINFQRNISKATVREQVPVRTGPDTPYFFQSQASTFYAGASYGAVASSAAQPLLAAPAQVTIELEGGEGYKGYQ